jgi:hypothetical protein
MLMSQIVAAHEAALDMYRRGWAQPPEYFDARCRYLQMADRAQRTVAILTERLDRHRPRTANLSIRTGTLTIPKKFAH